MKYLHALVWGLILGTFLRLWGYPVLRAKIEATINDLDDVWDVWDAEEEQ